MTEQEQQFVVSFNAVGDNVCVTSESKGWYIESKSPRDIATKIALMHSELSEALESLRRGDPPSDHIPEFSGMEEEFADTIIRIMHVARRMDLRVAEAILAKLQYNQTRQYQHGGKHF